MFQTQAWTLLLVKLLVKILGKTSVTDVVTYIGDNDLAKKFLLSLEIFAFCFLP